MASLSTRASAFVVPGIVLLLEAGCGLGLGGTAYEPGNYDSGESDTSSGGPGPPCTACLVDHDAGHAPDAATAYTGDAARDGAAIDADTAEASACTTCVAQTCPGAMTACGQGSDCQAFFVCDVACSGSDASECSNDCNSMHPTGAQDFAALTLCSLGCGAGCLAM